MLKTFKIGNRELNILFNHTIKPLGIMWDITPLPTIRFGKVIKEYYVSLEWLFLYLQISLEKVIEENEIAVNGVTVDLEKEFNN